MGFGGSAALCAAVWSNGSDYATEAYRKTKHFPCYKSYKATDLEDSMSFMIYCNCSEGSSPLFGLQELHQGF